MRLAYWTWSFYHTDLGETPIVLMIPDDLIIKEPIKIAIEVIQYTLMVLFQMDML